MSNTARTAEAPTRSFVERIRRERRNRGFGTRPLPAEPKASSPAPAPTTHDYSEKVRRERGSNLFLVRGNDSTGRAAWYFVLVDPAKKAAFRKAFTGQVELNAFGRIVASGYGAGPPASVRERMKNEYGFTGE